MIELKPCNMRGWVQNVPLQSMAIHIPIRLYHYQARSCRPCLFHAEQSECMSQPVGLDAVKLELSPPDDATHTGQR